MDYKTMRKEFEDRFNKANSTSETFYAFSNEQFDEGVRRAREAGITDKFCVGPCGLFGTQCAMDELVRLTREWRLDLLDAMKDPEFAIPAFKHEMWNHEYAYNWQGMSDVLGCFDYELGPEEENEDGTITQPITHVVTGERIDPGVIESFNTARTQYFKEFDRWQEDE